MGYLVNHSVILSQEDMAKERPLPQKNLKSPLAWTYKRRMNQQRVTASEGWVILGPRTHPIHHLWLSLSLLTYLWLQWTQQGTKLAWSGAAETWRSINGSRNCLAPLLESRAWRCEWSRQGAISDVYLVFSVQPLNVQTKMSMLGVPCLNSPLRAA